MTDIAAQTRTTTVSDELVAAYRRDGVVRVPQVLDPEAVARFHAAALAAKQAHPPQRDRPTFTQLVNVWRHDPRMRELTLDAGLARIATQLTGVPLRLWHDHILIKEPRNQAATEWHQDAPNWPLTTCRHALSAWIALVDVPAEKGCMTFIPGTQHLTGLRERQRTDHNDLFEVAPDLVYANRVTIPLRAGDCTFHNAYLAHWAAPNSTDQPRVAHVVAFIDAEATYSGSRPHPVTTPLDLSPGDRLPELEFPRLPRA